MEYDFGPIEALGVDINTGIGFTGNKDLYIIALQTYYKSSASNKEKIKEYLQSENMPDFAITVHALKSNSRTIGDASLGTKFETLEFAAKEGDIAKVKLNLAPALNEYEELLNALKPIAEGSSDDSSSAGGELSASQAKEIAEKLLAALEDFDDELSAELAAKLSAYPFRIVQKVKLKDATEKIADFNYDEAAELIKAIIPAIN